MNINRHKPPRGKTGKTIFTILTTQDNSIATSEHGTGGVQQDSRRGLENQKLNPEMGVLSTFSVMGAAVGFDQRRINRGGPKWEAYGGNVAMCLESTFGARDGGGEVMIAGLFKWGNVVKRRGEVGVCWLPGGGRKIGELTVANSPLSHLFLTSPKEQNAPVWSGAAQHRRMQISGSGGNHIAPGSLHPPLGPQLRQSGTVTFNSSARRRRGADLLDVAAKRVVYTGASSGQKPGRQSGALNSGLRQGTQEWGLTRHALKGG